MTFPAGPNALDAAWIESVLREGGAPSDARVRGISTTRIGEAFGFEGTSVRIVLEGDGRLPASLVAKWCGAAGGAREALFYREISRRIRVGVPRLAAAFVDEPADRALLVMEDVAPAVQGDSLAGVSEAHTRALARALAELHAPFWGRTDDSAVRGLPQWSPDPQLRVRETRAALAGFRETWTGRLTDEQIDAAESLPDGLPAAYDALFAAPPALIHGDFHADNVMFRPDGSPVLLDWPKVARGPAVVDVASFLFKRRAAAERLQRRGEWEALYADELGSRGVRDFDRGRVASGVAAAVVVFFAGAVRWAARTYATEGRPRVRALIEESLATGAGFVTQDVEAA
jgi:aminoglycoside phosphotransferase (APT) family kinase protein